MQRRQMQEVAGEASSSRHQLRTRVVKELNVPREFPISAGTQARYRNTGGVFVCEVGHWIAVCQAAVQCKGCTEKQASQQNQSGSSRMSSRSSAVATEGGSTHDSGSGHVVGG